MEWPQTDNRVWPSLVQRWDMRSDGISLQGWTKIFIGMTMERLGGSRIPAWCQPGILECTRTHSPSRKTRTEWITAISNAKPKNPSVWEFHRADKDFPVPCTFKQPLIIYSRSGCHQLPVPTPAFQMETHTGRMSPRHPVMNDVTGTFLCQSSRPSWELARAHLVK